jgi:hypothetical protein
MYLRAGPALMSITDPQWKHLSSALANRTSTVSGVRSAHFGQVIPSVVVLVCGIAIPVFFVL